MRPVSSLPTLPDSTDRASSDSPLRLLASEVALMLRPLLQPAVGRGYGLCNQLKAENAEGLDPSHNRNSLQAASR